MSAKALGRLRDRTQPRPGEPHRNLMAAVLRAAVKDAYDASARVNVMDYVMSTDRLWPFSFENLCEALEMDADDVRRQLHQLESSLTPPPARGSTVTAD
jgi:hypothetical protein